MAHAAQDSSELSLLSSDATTQRLPPTIQPMTVMGTVHKDMFVTGGGEDTFIDAGGREQRGLDVFIGNAGNDLALSHWGRDKLYGGTGDDVLVSRSDAGEPDIAQDPKAEKYYADQQIGGTADFLYGGSGADTFLFRFDLNATPEIIARHVEDNGDIDWGGVTGENGAPHLHWVEGIGRDTIQDFHRYQGDMIRLEGHTVDYEIRYRDTNGDGKNESIIYLYSNQGGAGAHDGDRLGSIVVFGNRVTDKDISLDNMAHHGSFGSITDIPLV